MELPEEALGRLRLDRVSRVAIQGNPDFRTRIMATNPPEKVTDKERTFSRSEAPMDAAGLDAVANQEIEETANFLSSLQDQPLLRRVATPAIGFDGNGLNIKEKEQPVARQMPPNPAYFR
jgi:hypothetical protein